jgi:hypothetical protein
MPTARHVWVGSFNCGEVTAIVCCHLQPKLADRSNRRLAHKADPFADAPRTNTILSAATIDSVVVHYRLEETVKIGELGCA